MKKFGYIDGQVLLYRGNYLIDNNITNIKDLLFPIRGYTSATIPISGLPSGETGGAGAVEVKVNYRADGGIQNLIMTWTKTSSGGTWQCTQNCADGLPPTASKWTDWKEITPG